ncbi:hypothetical protein N7G274_002926 [Stereocaulon virgatum]|uniref:Uncharacterized protein n=1 Tax=Stereocaulon virgatum TaxID=373712 RepID=A0ABR4AHB6_9LECA
MGACPSATSVGNNTTDSHGHIRESLRDIELEKILYWKISNLMLYEIRGLCWINPVRFGQVILWLDSQFDSVKCAYHVNIIMPWLQNRLRRHGRRYRFPARWRQNFRPQAQLTVS